MCDIVMQVWIGGLWLSVTGGFSVLLKQCKSMQAIEAQEVSGKEIFNTIMLLHTIYFSI